MLKKLGLYYIIFLTLVWFQSADFALADTAEAKKCNTQNDSLTKIICHSSELRSIDQKLYITLENKLSALDPESSRTLQQHQKNWFLELPSQCIDFRLTSMTDSRIGDAEKCILVGYQQRQQFLMELPLDTKPPAPYLFSGFERAMLYEHAMLYKYSPFNDELLGDKANPQMSSAFKRVFSAIIKSGVPNHNMTHLSRLQYFMAAADGLGKPYQIDEKRYLFATACQRHACSGHEAVVIIDLKTGELILADSTSQYLEVMFKSCTGNEIRQYARNKFKEWLAEKPSRALDSNIEEIESDNCK